MNYPNEESREQSNRPKFDTPFFVVRNDADIEQLRTFLANAVYDVADWAEDKVSNPLCRLGTKQFGTKYPDRVCTICVKKFTLLEPVKVAVEDRRKRQ